MTMRLAAMWTFGLLLVSGLSSCRELASTFDYNLPDPRVPDAGTIGADGDADNDIDGDTDTDADADADGDLDAGFVLDGNYESWPDPGGGEMPEVEDGMPTLTSSHTGWLQPRCFTCHGVGKIHPPDEHPAGLQYWAWSCARGLPGQSCHGHGTNGAPMFNHGGDGFFAGCTRPGCHDTFNAALKDRDNHGFMLAPDPFCNACHDYYWTGWPDDGFGP